MTQLVDVGDAKLAAVNYHNSGGYQKDLALVNSQVSAWLQERAPQVQEPALVLDIDDTALSNWEVIMANDFGRVFEGPCRDLPKGPCGWVAWDLLARSTAIPETQAVFTQVRSIGIEVFFLTERDEAQRSATVKNLRNAGYSG